MAQETVTQACEVSIILPTYNRAYCLRRSIDSVLNQTFTDFELLVIDDGSTDGTKALVETYDDPRIGFVHHTDNQRQTKRLNEGIRMARAPLIAFQDSDDEWLPEKLEKQVSAMRSASEDVGMVYVDKWRIEDGKEKFHWRSPNNMPEHGIIFDRALDDQLHNIGPQSVLIKKFVFDKVGLFDENLNRSNDWEMFIRISRHFLFFHIQEPLVNYHVSSDSMSAMGETSGIEAVELILAKYLEDFKRNPPLLAKRAYWIGSFHMRDGEVEKGRRYLSMAFRAQPLNLRYASGFILSALGKPVYAGVHRLLKRVSR